MPPYDFYQETAANVKQTTDPGYGMKILFSETGEFTSIATPSAATVEGDTAKITGNHTFPSGKGFVAFTGHTDGVEMEGATQGEPGFVGLPDYKPKIMLVGDHAALKEKVENLTNKPLIILLVDPRVGDTRRIQLGSKDEPCVVTGITYKSGGRKKGGFKGYELSLQAGPMFEYSGTVTLKT